MAMGTFDEDETATLQEIEQRLGPLLQHRQSGAKAIAQRALERGVKRGQIRVVGLKRVKCVEKLAIVGLPEIMGVHAFQFR